MKYLNICPSRKELHADDRMSRGDYRDWLRVAELGETLGMYLHGMISKRSFEKAEATLQQIIASGHDLQDGSVFCCGPCWETARHYRRTGHLNMPTPAPRACETVDDLDYLKCHL